MPDSVPSGSDQISKQAAPQPPEEEEVDGYAVVNDLLDQNKDVSEIIRTLEDGGVSHDEAVIFVQDVIAQRSARVRGLPDGRELRQLLKQAGQKNMLIGGLVCVAGIIITLGTLAAASGPAGGSYVIAWGAIVWGAIQFFRGMGQASQADQLPEREFERPSQGLDFQAQASTLRTREKAVSDAGISHDKASAQESIQEKRVPFSLERKVFCNQCQQTFRTTVLDKCPLCRATNSLVDV